MCSGSMRRCMVPFDTNSKTLSISSRESVMIGSKPGGVVHFPICLASHASDLGVLKPKHHLLLSKPLKGLDTTFLPPNTVATSSPKMPQAWFSECGSFIQEFPAEVL